MIVKSPIFYMGNKYDLMHNLLMYFPKQEEVDLFIDLFGGSGTVSANVPYQNVIYNELNNNIVELIYMFKEKNSEFIINHIKKRIEEFDLSKDNSNVYNKFRSFYNKQKEKNIIDLYTLTLHSFSNLIRFNSENEFNMPNGKRTFNIEHEINIKLFCDLLDKKNIDIRNQDAFDILKQIKSNEGQFIYLDPPYSNTTAIYNEQRAFGGWNIEHDYKMFEELDRLNALGIKWALSNVLENKGIRNTHLEKWSLENGYAVIDFENKQYASLGKGNAKSQEVLIINYKAPFERISIFDL